MTTFGDEDWGGDIPGGLGRALSSGLHKTDLRESTRDTGDVMAPPACIIACVQPPHRGIDTVSSTSMNGQTPP